MQSLKKFDTLFKPTSDDGVQVWQCEVFQDGDFGVIITQHGKQGGKMQTQTDVVRAGKNVGRKNQTSPFEQAKIDAEAEWSMKQRRKGYALDVNDSKRWDAPMLAQKFRDVQKKVNYAHAVGQQKLNGYRCLARRDEAGVVTLTSREYGPFHLPHVIEALTAKMQPGDMFDGEIYRHGLPLRRISSLIKRPRAESEQLEFNLYDSGLERPYWEREAFLADRLGGEDRYGPLVLLGSTPIPNEAALIAFQKNCVDEGYEGAMLRWGDNGYEFGVRSAGLLKFKNFLDEEFEITGCNEGRGSYEGMAIFQCKTAAGHPFDAISPGTHEMKRHYWLCHRFYIGCMLTVRFYEWTTTDAPVPFHGHGRGFKDSPQLKAAEKARKAEGFDLSLFD